MQKLLQNKALLLLVPIISLTISCQKNFDPKDFSAYIQGEIINPTANYVLFCKDNVVIDTLFLDKENKFYKKFDSLTPGMYIYKHDPEFQYVYFDKNDSLTLRLNSKDFDHSIIFSGRGAEKNNFLMNLTVRNIMDESEGYSAFDVSPEKFTRRIDSVHAARTTYYLRNKAIISWSDDFDLYAKAKLDLHFYSLKELYPTAHFVRTDEDVRKKLPKDYYTFRKKINFNDDRLLKYSSFTKYLAIMLNTIVNEPEVNLLPENKFDKYIDKLNIVDTLIKNNKVKNAIFDNIAFIYLLEDQNLTNNDLFLDRYFELSTDKNQHNEIIQIQQAIQNLKYENKLPEVALVNTNSKKVNINSIINKKTLVFFWTKNGMAHADAAHQLAAELKADIPNIDIISVCIDGDQGEWLNIVKKYPSNGIIELRSDDFNQMKNKWIITKIQRSMILDKDGTIIDPFINIFDKNFENLLK
ncbi:thioredoxin family protein [Myroides sp. M-43]|uniref:thioredoxin family protein n=1 Tax=Myroides oncorhynchi TaxID=2893756 RepID=UPI001E5E1932|nr:thioredoxin-like domain-containing protein [Myroides oncorhynchi]MCC9044426.1 thioredoxin family protein [Myroides oncorhynchi]